MTLPFVTSWNLRRYWIINEKFSCFASSIFILLAVLVNSRLLLAVGGFGLFGYIGYLAAKVFKNSMLLPFALTLVGLSVISTGLAFQSYQDALYARMLDALKYVLSLLMHEQETAANLTLQQLVEAHNIPVDWTSALAIYGGHAQQVVKAVSWPYNVFAWFETSTDSSFLSLIATKSPIKIMSDAYVATCIVSICSLLLVIVYSVHRKFYHVPLDKNAPPALQVLSWQFKFPQDTQQCGFQVEITASKPSQLTVSSAKLRIVKTDENNVFGVLSKHVPGGSAAVGLVKMTMYPLTLTPRFLDASVFEAGSNEVKFVVQLGTGINNTIRVPQTLMKRVLNAVKGSPMFTIYVEYTDRVTKRRGILLKRQISFREILDEQLTH
eukprot:CAMPEP_0201562194 /NCGR_PEP_ID=MMETSP0173_2-20130828/79195_1 /ASSEMBLY_ACC=CAM_ASM_000268 /TAXON_ID=218659 /ORGANISM="Vexillifera sp., Strain DIVA3 564/2" /LENGTH=380 /DNA_ID=CAMNT_0047976741 /DNA_START=1672 /DNA_END=2814 /DNA_ORIENTATION=-